MAELTGTWDRDRLRAFLEETVVPLRLACTTPSDRLWMVSLWYRFDDGQFVCATSKRADLVRYLDHDPHVAFEVSTNEPPYKGVRGNGSVAIEADADKAVLRSLIERYVGGTDSAFARRLLDDDRDEVALSVAPERLYTWDFSSRMRDV